MDKASHLSLAGLRDRLSAGLRTMVVQDDAGHISEMVYIPRYTVYANSLFGGTWPTDTMHLGGFLVDKYQASHCAATIGAMGYTPGDPVVEDDGNIAVSRLGVPPWTNVGITRAIRAANNRVVSGYRCSLVGPLEWMSVAVLAQILGGVLHGNTAAGYDWRVAGGSALWEAGGSLLSGSKWRCGTGPANTGLLGYPLGGLCDLVGNVHEMQARVEAGAMELRLPGILADDHDDDDVSIELFVDDANRPHWQVPGVLRVGEEDIFYNGLTKITSGRYTATDCVRGYGGTTAAAHADGDDVVHVRWVYTIPGGFLSHLANAGLNNTDDPATVAIAGYTGLEYYAGGVFTALRGHGRTTDLEVGDIFLVGAELVRVEALLGSDVYTVARGIGDTTVAAHAVGDTVTLVPATMGYLVDSPNYPTLRGAIASLASSGLHAVCGLPGSTAANLGLTGRLDVANVRLGLDCVLARGGAASEAEAMAAQSPWHLQVRKDPVAFGDDADDYMGFRCCLYLPPYSEAVRKPSW